MEENLVGVFRYPEYSKLIIPKSHKNLLIYNPVDFMIISRERSATFLPFFEIPQTKAFSGKSYLRK